MPIHITLLKAILFAIMFLVVGSFAFGLPTTNASSMTLYVSNSFYVCVGFKSTWGPSLAFSGGPSNHFWAIRAGTGLEDGDTTQYATYQFTVIDSANGATVARAGAPTWKWIVVGSIVYVSTMSAWIGGYPELYYYFDNNDPSQQCFYVYYSAFYE